MVDWLRDSESHRGSRAYETWLETPPSRRWIMKWHGGWVLPPHELGLESSALLVEPPPYEIVSPRTVHEVSSHLLRLMSWRREADGTLEAPSACHIDDKKNEHRCHSVFPESHPRAFPGGCFGVCGTPPSKPLGSVKSVSSRSLLGIDHPSSSRHGDKISGAF